MDNKLLLIINPKSGIAKKSDIYEKVNDIFSSYGWNTVVKFTEKPAHAIEIAANAVDYNRIICMGGDGTLNEVCNGIQRADIKVELGYIPSGSTNDFARGLGLPKSYKKNAELAACGDILPIDIGTFSDDVEEKRYFSYVASFGIFTQVAYKTNQKFKNVFGHLAYIFEGLKCMTDFDSYKPFKLKIEYGDTVIEDEFLFGAITNSASLGGLMKLNKKEVLIDDGQFELLLIRKPKNIIALTGTMGQILKQKYKSDKIIFEHVKNVKLTAETPLNWTLDGEYAGNTTVAKIEVLEKAINFVRKEKIKRRFSFFKRKPKQ